MRASETSGMPAVMAILNITPDSFSDGGEANSADKALARALAFEREGAAILDIGAESTRPGAVPVSGEEEIERLTPVLERLSESVKLPISVDTYKAEVARFALSHGASVVNDIWGLQRDPAMASVVADYGVDVVIMHNRFEGADDTIDILEDINRWFDESLALARKADIADERIILDPGIGFGKTFDQNLTVLAHLDRLKAFGYPILVGLSRKRFIGAILDAEVGERLYGTLGANLYAVFNGASIVRVHDVKAHVEAIKLWVAIDARRR